MPSTDDMGRNGVMPRWTGFSRPPQPVIMHEFPQLPAQVMRVRAAIADVAGAMPVLYGGVLRDVFHGAAYRDIDCAVCPAGTTDDFPAALARAGFRINAQIDISSGHYGYGASVGTGGPVRRLKAAFDGARVDIAVWENPPSATKYAATGLEVSGSIAMDRDGTVLAHPGFARTDPRRTYAVNSARLGIENWPSIYHRYRKFSARHGGIGFRIGG